MKRLILLFLIISLSSISFYTVCIFIYSYFEMRTWTESRWGLLSGWVQAVGSIGAILGAFAVARYQAQRALEAARKDAIEKSSERHVAAYFYLIARMAEISGWAAQPYDFQPPRLLRWQFELATVQSLHNGLGELRAADFPEAMAVVAVRSVMSQLGSIVSFFAHTDPNTAFEAGSDRLKEEVGKYLADQKNLIEKLCDIQTGLFEKQINKIGGPETFKRHMEAFNDFEKDLIKMQPK